MELVFIFAVVFSKIFFLDFFEVVEIIRTFWVYALMYNEVPAFFPGNKGVATMGTAKLHRRKTAVLRRKSGSTDFTEDLPFRSIVFVKEWFRSITAWAGAGIRDVAFRAAADGPDFLTIAFFVVRDEFSVSPVLTEIGDQREFINFELLILWRVGIIKCPLLKRDVSANKVDQPAVLLVKVLN